ncbi:fatty acid desaturase family protein [Portibacter lacus]|uniref:Fatty acid desaturase n=1 Tax=Portibacter lacus TaxID=1099794 RepID=A0AA37SNT8_9BACT|nr:fatty acid desaturase [Portibacter lacus]GLR18173.1 fatty acid desaturase [Portibacter lacus]
MKKITSPNKIDDEIKSRLKNWKEIIENYKIPDNTKAVMQIITSFIPFIALWVLMYYSLSWSIWITLGLGVINGFFLVRIFIIQHDCGHQSFLTSKRWNEIVGWTCSIFSSLPFKYWAKVHNFHHAHSGQLETRDIGDVPFKTTNEFRSMSKWGKFKYRLLRTPLVLFVISPIYYFAISNRLGVEWKAVKRVSLKMLFKNNFLIAAVYIGLAWLIGWKEFFLIQFMLIFVFAVIAFWFFYIQHQHEFSYKHWKKNWDFLVSAIRGSTYYKLPKPLQWLTGNIGIHHIHHLSASIPNYNLPKALKEHKILSEYVTVVRIKDTFKILKSKLWDEELEKMLSFKEYYQLERMRMAR